MQLIISHILQLPDFFEEELAEVLGKPNKQEVW
jgi:hypothetical protein